MTPRRAWRRFWEHAPRQLRFTREGKVLVAVALCTGFAALNTGNNLLYLGWGMILSAIVLSGVLSEAALRKLGVAVRPPPECRAGLTALLPLRVHNASGHVPSYCVETVAHIASRDHALVATAPLQVRLGALSDIELCARFTPKQRGRHEVSVVVVSTAYPFGFFEKSRRLMQAPVAEFWSYPRRIDVQHLLQTVLARMGDAPANRPGRGEDFFSLRPYRTGDDVRHVSWRRSARTGRWVVVEKEATLGRELLLELALLPDGPSAQADNEHTIAAAGSLAEALLPRGYRIGLRAPGCLTRPDGGEAARRGILGALARLQTDLPLPPLPAPLRLTRVALVAAGAEVPFDADVILRLGDAGNSSDEHGSHDEHGGHGEVDGTETAIVARPRQTETVA